MPSTCKSCGATIYWAATPNGKRMPLDEEKTPDGEWHVQNGRATLKTRDGQLGYKPHWATCPHADQHRKSRASA